MLKRLRRYICVLLTAAMVMMFTPVFGITVSAETSGDGWSFDETTGALTITTNGGTTAWRSSCDKKLVQSVEIQEGVTSIGGSAFSGCTALVSIEIPDSVKSIGSQAFSSCYKLESIKIPNGVTSIGLMTFWDCLDLASIEIPDSVTSIENFAFVGCRSLTSIEMPNNVISIGWSAFYDCKGLASIEIPDSVTSIGGAAFEGCSSLTSIVIPDSVTSIGNDVFEDCSSLDNIIYPGGLDVSGASIPDTATQVEYTDNNGEVTITEIILPDGKEPVEIPNTIGGKNIMGVAENFRDMVSESGHTHQNEHGATCEKRAVCKICGNYGELAAHTLTKTEAKNPTCTEVGNIAYWTCSVCKKTFSDENGSNEITDTVIPAANHTMTHTERKEPTCTEAGNIEYWTCSVCKKTFSDENGSNEITDTVIPAANHTMTHTERKEPTCTEAGNIEYWTCSVCKKTFSDENGSNEITDTVIPAANHTMMHTERKEPTCMEAGNIEYWTCSKCNKIFGDSEGVTGVTDTGIGALGHDYVNGKCTRCQGIKPDHEHVGGTATCTQKAVCDICGEEYGEFTAHTPDSGTVTLYPTETREGTIEYRCTVCGSVIRTETINKLPGGGSGTPSRPSRPTPSEPAAPDEPVTPSQPDNNVPFIKGENSKNGWEIINEEIDKAEDGSTVTVDMNGATVVPRNVFNTLRGRDVTVVFDMGGGIIWSVNGKDVTFDNTLDIDFSVKADTDNIPVDVINNITGERYSIQISLAHNGEFGFTAVLSINLGNGNAGQKASLYYYSDGTLELMCESEISSDGTAQLTFTHASDYLIVIGESKTDEGDTSDTTSSAESNPSEDDNSGTTSGTTSSGGVSGPGKKDSDEQDGNPSTGVATSLIPLAIAAAFIVAAAKRKMK